MGLGTERYNAADGHRRASARTPSRAASHERAAAATKDGRFADEIVPVEVPQRKGDPLVVDTDEGVRPGTTAESLGELRPAFDKNGTITAGNASQISDGGAAVIVMSSAQGRGARGCPRSASSSATAWSPGPTPRCCTQPSHAIRQGPRPRRASTSATSTCSRSTRPSPPSVWPRSTTSASPRTWSTSTAAPSPSATRSACRAPGSPSRRCSSCGAAAASTAAVALCGGGGQGDAAILRTL